MTSVFERRADPRAGEGGAAFPHTAADGHRDYRPGMTLRDYFAGQALGLMLHEGVEMMVAQAGEFKEGVVDGIVDSTARMAYRFADAMLKARAGE